jgi:hypothetical protein
MRQFFRGRTGPVGREVSRPNRAKVGERYATGTYRGAAKHSADEFQYLSFG